MREGTLDESCIERSKAQTSLHTVLPRLTERRYRRVFGPLKISGVASSQISRDPGPHATGQGKMRLRLLCQCLIARFDVSLSASSP